MPLPRRDFLKLSAAAGAALAPLGAAEAQPSATTTTTPSAPGRPRNIVFVVADGMSSGTLQLADVFSRLTRKRPLRWTELWNRPGVRRATCSTYAADGWVADSAAAASAWSIGRRINNGVINITPDGREHRPILVAGAADGLASGCVTTTRITHATPACFYANIINRDLEQEIAVQLLDRRLDVALGGGSHFFAPAVLARRPDLRVVRTREELLAEGGTGPLLGLFHAQHMSYEIDRPPTEPTLAEMTSVALGRLAATGRGFILQVEGGRVDHAAHANDAGAMLHDMLAFDDAAGVVLDFAAARDDTLVVITTDHGCANPGLTFYGKEGVALFERTLKARRSFEWIEAQAVAIADPAERIRRLPSLIQEASGVALSQAELALVLRLLRGEGVHPFRVANTFFPLLGTLLANHLGVAFLSPNHTSDFVEVTALGPGSEILRPHIENTDLHAMLRLALKP